MPPERVVVVGTTTDYVEHIRSRYPQRALFVTDLAERFKASEPVPGSEEEVVADLADVEAVLSVLLAHIDQQDMTVAGVTCFDCESLMLASAVAQALAVPFPSAPAIARCRNKYLARQRWKEVAVPCPDFSIISNVSELEVFLRRKDRPVVMKPLSGSGSEMVFKCLDEAECLYAFKQIQMRLAGHVNVRMYRNETCYPEGTNPRDAVMVEDFIEGKEYSCDFFVDGPNITILRIAEKYTAEGHSFGTTLAYRVPGVLPDVLSHEYLENVLQRTAHALGIGRAVCMADVMVNNDGIFVIELTPRPGGDCLPPIIFQSCGLDMLGLALDVAAGKPVMLPGQEDWKRMVGVRVLADKAGMVRSIDTRCLKKDHRVMEVFFKARPGSRIVQPPDDYDSRMLGHIIFAPDDGEEWQEQCLEILEKVTVNIQ